MGIWQTVALAVGLGADVMSVTAAVGVRWHGRRRALRLALHMGLFQLVMPLIGWWAGRRLAGLLARAGGYLAAALLVGMGVKMLIEALRARPGAAAEAVEHGAE
ncbi:MAG: manganese efflux pump MntP family protein, partial [Planctomycetota bacterium]